MESRINLSTRFRHAQQLDRPQPVHETEYLSVSLWSPQISFCPCLRDAWIRIKYELNAIYTDPFWQSSYESGKARIKGSNWPFVSGTNPLRGLFLYENQYYKNIKTWRDSIV